MKIRGFATLAAFGVTFTVCDLIQRTAVVALARLRPGRREAILAWWQRMMASMVIGTVRSIGGAELGELPSIPGGGGILVLMNHQSLLDVPIVCASMDGKYPKILTRKRYGRRVPLISHMVRLYQYPLLDPGATTRGQLKHLREQAAESSHPFVIFPEGTRTRTGDIGRFKTLGLRTVLEARPWSVYVLVADGFWRWARLKRFGQNLSSMKGRVECAGPFESPSPGSDLNPFISEMRAVMIETLDRIRRAPVL